VSPWCSPTTRSNCSPAASADDVADDLANEAAPIADLGAMYADALIEWESSEEGADWDSVDTASEIAPMRRR